MCTFVRVCAVCSFVLGEEGRGVQLVYAGTCCWCGGLFLDRESMCCLCLVYFLTGMRVYVGVCVYKRRHTHTLGYSEVSPGVRTRRLEGPKNPDGLNLGIYVFVYAYTVHMCIHMLGGVLGPN